MKQLLAFSLILVFLSLEGCMVQEENSDMHFSFESAKVSATRNTPTGFYVRGHMEDGQFVPEGKILGDGSLDVEGRAGWMELPSGKFFPFHAAKSPKSPYVKGHMTPNGFVPSTRELH